MRRYFALIALVSGICSVNVSAQHAANPSARYFRAIALVHLTGSGKHDDPIRPEYTPVAADATRAGIVAWTFQATDDKSMAIVQYVAVNHHALDALLNDKRPEIRVFEIGQQSQAAIEAELRKFKKDFSLDNLKVVAQ